MNPATAKERMKLAMKRKASTVAPAEELRKKALSSKKDVAPRPQELGEFSRRSASPKDETVVVLPPGVPFSSMSVASTGERVPDHVLEEALPMIQREENVAVIPPSVVVVSSPEEITSPPVPASASDMEGIALMAEAIDQMLEQEEQAAAPEEISGLNKAADESTAPVERSVAEGAEQVGASAPSGSGVNIEPPAAETSTLPVPESQADTGGEDQLPSVEEYSASEPTPPPEANNSLTVYHPSVAEDIPPNAAENLAPASDALHSLERVTSETLDRIRQIQSFLDNNIGSLSFLSQSNPVTSSVELANFRMGIRHCYDVLVRRGLVSPDAVSADEVARSLIWLMFP